MMRTLFVLCLCAFTPIIAHAQGRLENPTPNSIQSGQGIISGWLCQATTVELVVDGTIRVQAPYGTLRGDTQATCGDVNNGFGFQVNWGELGDGTHSLVVLVDGAQFAQVGFSVKTLGVPYLTGASGTYQIQGFSGKNVTVQWSEPLQNFTITGWSPAGTPPPPPGGSSLQGLLGRWTFTYAIISTFTDHYLLPSVTTSNNGTPIILGTDIDGGGAIIAARIQDLSTSPLPYEFALLDPDSIICDFFVFDKTGANTVSGQYLLLSKNTAGDCDEIIGNTPHSMSGLRTSMSTSLQAAPSSLLLDTQKQHEEQLADTATQEASMEEEPQIDRAVLRDILQNMQRK